MAYATRANVYALGLSAMAFASRPRPVASGDADAASATIRLTAHGLSDGDVVTFVVTSGGALPTGVSAFVPYYAHVVTSDLFRVSTTSGGVPIASWVSAGSGWAISVDPGPRIDAHLEDAAARIDECLTAHDPPLLVDPTSGKYPAVIVGLNARMAALSAVDTLAFDNPAFRSVVDRLEAQRDWDGYGDKGAIAGTLLGDWKLGKPVQPRPTDEDNTLDNAAIATASDPMPWRSASL